METTTSLQSGIRQNNFKKTKESLFTTVLCPVCNSSRYKKLFSDLNRRDNIYCSGVYVECIDCSCVYLRERPRWDEIRKYYSSSDSFITANTGKNCEIENLRERLINNIPLWKRYLRKIRFRPHSWPLESISLNSKRLLDLGCGSGAKLYEFAQRGYDVYGVDVGTDAIECCKKLFPEGHFLQSELQNINFPDKYFDYIRMDNALEHVPNVVETIKECHRLLKEGGKIFVYIPHGRSMSMRLMKNHSITSWIPFHLQLFTKKSIYKLLKDAGFENIHIQQYSPCSWIPLSIMQWRYRNESVMKFNSPLWLETVCRPVGWLASKIGLGEELVVTGTRA